MGIRYATKFTSSDGTTTVFTFPLKRYEFTDNQSLRTAYGTAVGASYGHDFLGTGVAPKAIAKSTVRFYAVEASSDALDDEADEFRADPYMIGMGKLWTTGDDASVRWAWARLEAMPEIMVAVGQTRHMPTALQFSRLSDWYNETATTHTEVVTASPDTFNVTNPGNATVRNAVIRFRANATGGFSVGFTLENLTTGQSFTSARASASANSEVKVDCGALTVEYSNDDGANYADDLANFTRGANQAAFMDFAPGVNSIRATVGGTENVNIDFSFSGAWH